MRGGRNSTPSGVLVGHSEGITYVTSKGDNRYLASNGKDQKMLLWDLRMMYSKQEFADLPRRRRPMFDYRTTQYRGSRSTKVPGDCSVMSFQGHEVLRTLIRCHFSPVHTTGQRYLYSGSSDGMVHIYRLDGTLVRKLDTNAAFENYTKSPDSTSVARDVSWHPHYPTLISSCSGDMDYGFRASALSGGLVQHTFTRRGEMGEMDLGEVEDVSDTELPPRPRQRRRFGW
ncbi:hypothetical protein BGZ98_002711 [Dissophora globulifera]|nr:hypothetical protein BGZ98_002711 [Dissophora globulifera]